MILYNLSSFSFSSVLLNLHLLLLPPAGAGAVLRSDRDDVSDFALLRRRPQRRPQELPQHVRHLLRLQMNHRRPQMFHQRSRNMTDTKNDKRNDLVGEKKETTRIRQ